jgi:PAS domain S-box-containing protein
MTPSRPVSLTEAARKSEERLRAIFDSMLEGCQIIGRDWRYLYVNDVVARQGKSTKEELIGLTMMQAYPGIENTQLFAILRRCMEERTHQRLENEFIFPDGSKGWFELSIHPIPDGVFILSLDITERKRAEEETRRLNRALQVLSDCNQALVRAADEEALLRDICRIIVNIGGYRMTWVGEAEDDEEKNVRPLAHAGIEPGYFDSTRLTWAGGPAGQNPAGTAIRTGQPYLARNAPAEPAARPWRPEAGRQDFAAVLSLPLILDERPAGALTICAAEPDAFSAQEVRLLTELSGDLAYGLAALRTRAAHARAEQQAQRNAARAEALMRTAARLNAQLDLQAVIGAVCAEAGHALHTSAAWVNLYDETRDVLAHQGGFGLPPGFSEAYVSPPRALFEEYARRLGPVMVIPDVQALAGIPNASVYAAFDARTTANAGMLREGQLIGVLSVITFGATRVFTEDELALLQGLADQAAQAIANARLFTERRRINAELQAKVATLQTLTEIDREIIAAREPLVILNMVCRRAAELVHAPKSVIVIAAADRLDVQSHYGLTDPAAARSPAEFNARENIRAQAVAPLLLGDHRLGELAVFDTVPRAWSADELDVLAALAGQTAIAIEKARLFEAERAGRGRLKLLYLIGQTFNLTEDIDAILDLLTDAAMQETRATHGSVLLARLDLEEFERCSLRGYTPEQVEAARRSPMALEHGLNGRAYRARQIVSAGDVQADPDYVPLLAETRSQLIVPIVRGDRVIGNLDLQSPQVDAFRDVDLDFLRALTDQVAIALEKALLIDELEAERASLARSVEERTAELRDAYERLRLAHDDVSRALEKERELGELKSRFISMASHEFRTPLATILSSAELLEHYGHQWAEDRKLDHLRRIESATKNMTLLLDDVLLVGKAEAGKLEFAPAPLDLERFCRDMAEELQLGAGAQHVLTLAVHGDGTRACMDEKLLRHILGNLLLNAIKYSPPGSTVRFELTCQAGQAGFVIQDAGLGIPPADLARMFEPFHRAGNVKGIPGTGLGLAIVKRSVDLHGGTISVTSALNQGTTIEVTLPLGAAE